MIGKFNIVIIGVVTVIVIVFAYGILFLEPYRNEQENKILHKIITTDCGELKQLIKNYTSYEQEIKNEYWIRCEP